MPKRDPEYMAGQRHMIAKAALKVLLRKGVRETTLRDICREAGISVGALYIHFKTKEEVTVAACQLDFYGVEGASLPQTWQEYLATAAFPERRNDSRLAKRLRLSLQFAAELTQMERNPEGLTRLYESYRERITATLGLIKEQGEIAVPLGIEKTADMHLQLIFGAMYQYAWNRDLPVEQINGPLHCALALTAGRTEISPVSSQVPSPKRSGGADRRPVHRARRTAG